MTTAFRAYISLKKSEFNRKMWFSKLQSKSKSSQSERDSRSHTESKIKDRPTQKLEDKQKIAIHFMKIISTLISTLKTWKKTRKNVNKCEKNDGFPKLQSESKRCKK